MKNFGVYDYHTNEFLGDFLSITERQNIGQSGTAKIWYVDEDGAPACAFMEDILVKEIDDFGPC